VTPPAPHRPVLPTEVVELLAPIGSGWVVDGTVGFGGHAEEILRSCPGLRILGIDRDPSALIAATRRLAPFGARFRPVRGNFRNLSEHLSAAGLERIDGILLDLGVSSEQLNRPERGFSFRRDGPLDMRMDPSAGPTAADWLDAADPRAIADVLRRYGEERYAERIARAIASEQTRRGRIETTGRLAEIVRAAVPGRYFAQRIDPATRTFQALRIAVNDELEALSSGLSVGFERLRPGGILVVISFHSLEDRIVKAFLRDRAAVCTCPPDFPECVCGKRIEAEILTRRPVVASEAEARANPRARSAKLRAGRKIAPASDAPALRSK